MQYRTATVAAVLRKSYQVGVIYQKYLPFATATAATIFFITALFYVS